MNPLTALAEPLQVTIARGNIYVPRAVYETYFKGIESVALMPHEEGVLLIPLIQQSAGGLLLKIKNLRGDRVIHAQEFWRQHGYAEDFIECAYPVRWNSERAALLLSGIQCGTASVSDLVLADASNDKDQVATAPRTAFVFKAISTTRGLSPSQSG